MRDRSSAVPVLAPAISISVRRDQHVQTLLPSFAVAWLMWTGVGRGSNLGAVGLFGGLSPFLLFLGHQALVKESLSITAATLIVIIMVGPDMVSGFERRRNLSDRVPFVSGLLYLVLVFILYIALVFTAGLDARS